MNEPESNIRYESISPARAAAHRVAQFRAGLDWMLAHPLWEGIFALALIELGMKGQRQGIARAAALRSLALERKFSLVRHALQQGLPTPSYSESIVLARHWGVTDYRRRADFQQPSAKQWSALQSATLIRITTRHQHYKSAQSTLFAAYQELPSELSRTICYRPDWRDDACQEARLALLHAIDRIDPMQSFEAYARQWIKRRIQNFLMREKAPVTAPINLISKSLREHSEGNPLLEKAIREGVVQLDIPTTSESEILPEFRSDPEKEPAQVAILTDECQIVAEALLALTAKQREVIVQRFGIASGTNPRSLAQIAKRAGISRQQVFQREKRALQKLYSALAEVGVERRQCASSRGSY